MSNLDDNMLGGNNNKPVTITTGGIKNDSLLSISGNPSSYSTYFFGGTNGQPLLTLKPNGAIIANPAVKTDEVTNVFLSSLENTHGTLPAKIKRLEEEAAAYRDKIRQMREDATNMDAQMEAANMAIANLVKGEDRDTKRLDYIFNLINERGVSGFAARIHWDCAGLDRLDIDCAMKGDGFKLD